MKRLYYSAKENIQKLVDKESWITWGNSAIPFKSDSERIAYNEKIGRDHLAKSKHRWDYKITPLY